MTQPARGPAPIGVVYNTSMARPDAALALAALHVLASRRELRLGSVCVTGAGLASAIFCDIVANFYAAGPRLPNSNQALPIGLAAVSPLPADSPMVQAVVNRKKNDGGPAYARTIRSVSDTALAEAVLRNGMTFNATTVVVLSAPATWLARSLDLPGARAIYQERIKRLVIVEPSTATQDAAALQKILSDWPSPIVICGSDVGEALSFPGASVDTAFGWAPLHPVADAYRAFKPMPYDAPLHDLAALHYAVQPDSGFFTLVEKGSSNRLSVVAEKTHDARAALTEVASARPVAPPGRRGGG
jgi:purine nucleosidase